MPRIPKTTKLKWIPERKPHEGRKFTTDFYHTTQWRRLRAWYLKEYPLCVECQKKGKLTPAKVCDHITPISKGGHKTDPENLQGLCSKCHNIKSAKERHQ